MGENYPLMPSVDHWKLIHPVWLQEYLAEQCTLYGSRPSVWEALEAWNRNKNYFCLVYGM